MQEKLVYPECRYLIGKEPLVFETHASTLDFRADQDRHTIRRDVSVRSTESGSRAWSRLFAYDLKTRKELGELCYLEVNSGPMF